MSILPGHTTDNSFAWTTAMGKPLMMLSEKTSRKPRILPVTSGVILMRRKYVFPEINGIRKSSIQALLLCPQLNSDGPV
jgi:hypothetical protein